jgi:MerR family regulatory protein
MGAITFSRAENLPTGELSKRSDVNIETIRYYQRIKILPAPHRTTRGRRIHGNPTFTTFRRDLLRPSRPPAFMWVDVLSVLRAYDLLPIEGGNNEILVPAADRIRRIGCNNRVWWTEWGYARWFERGRSGE